MNVGFVTQLVGINVVYNKLGGKKFKKFYCCNLATCWIIKIDVCFIKC